MDKKSREIDISCERLAEIIKDSGLTQYEFAEKVDYAPETISRLVNGYGTVSKRLADRVYDKFGFKADWLLGYHDFKTQDDLNRHYINRHDEQNKAYITVLDRAVTEACLRKGVPPVTLDNIPEILFLEAQIKDFANTLVWQYLFNREHSATWAILDERGKD